MQMLETHSSVARPIESKHMPIFSLQTIWRELKDGVKEVIKNTFVLCLQLPSQIVSKPRLCTEGPCSLWKKVPPTEVKLEKVPNMDVLDQEFPF